MYRQQIMFNKFRKDFYRFLIPVSFLTYPLLLIFSETVNAQTVQLTCYVKTHVQRWENEDWSDINDQTWDLEIDYNKNLVVRRRNILYEGKNYPLRWNYTIFTADQNKIVAFNYEDMSSEKDGLAAGSLTLDLISKKLTTANHMNDERGFSFSLHYGRCFQK